MTLVLLCKQKIIFCFPSCKSPPSPPPHQGSVVTLWKIWVCLYLMPHYARISTMLPMICIQINNFWSILLLDCKKANKGPLLMILSIYIVVYYNYFGMSFWYSLDRKLDLLGNWAKRIEHVGPTPPESNSKSILGPKRCWVQKKWWVQKNLVLKNFGSNKCL